MNGTRFSIVGVVRFARYGSFSSFTLRISSGIGPCGAIASFP
jgi:hypothetical protein